MPQFSSSDINEAKRRVKEMQERARSYSHSDEKPIPEKEHNSESTEAAGEKSASPFGIFDFLSSLTSDDGGSKGIILALILILSKEKADNMLILALLYILL